MVTKFHLFLEKKTWRNKKGMGSYVEDIIWQKCDHFTEKML